MGALAYLHQVWVRRRADPTRTRTRTRTRARTRTPVQAEDVRVEAEQIMRIKNTLVTMYATPTPLNRDPNNSNP